MQRQRRALLVWSVCGGWRVLEEVTLQALVADNLEQQLQCEERRATCRQVVYCGELSANPRSSSKMAGLLVSKEGFHVEVLRPSYSLRKFAMFNNFNFATVPISSTTLPCSETLIYARVNGLPLSLDVYV